MVAACVLFGLAIAWFNPNYQWSPQRNSPLGADFLQEWTAGDMVWQGAGDQIYQAAAFDAWQHDATRLGFSWPADQYYPAVYPPHYYLLVAPLARLPYRAAVYVWLAMMIAAYAWSARLLLPQPSTRLQTWFWMACLIFPPTFLGLVLGQKGTLWLAILASSFVLLRSQRPLASGAMAALLTLKPTLALVIPLAMVANRQWRFMLGFICSALVLIGLSLACLPLSLWSDYLQVVLGGASYQTHGGYHSGWSTSVISLLKYLGLQGTLGWLAYAACAAGVLAGLLPLRHDQSGSPSLAQPQYWISLLAATSLLSPHAYFYDLVWLLVPLSALLSQHPRQALTMCLILWLAALWAQNFPDGPPCLPIVLLGMLVYRWPWAAPLQSRPWPG